MITKKQLRIISKEDLQPDTIVIDSSNDGHPVLTYQRKDGTSVIIDGSDNYENLAKVDTLLSLLHERDWNITTRPFIKEDSLYISKESVYDSDIPIIEEDMTEGIKVDESFTPEDLYSIENNYSRMVTNKGIAYSGKGDAINLDLDYYNRLNFEDKTEFDLLSLYENSLDYTGSLNLNRFESMKDSIFKVVVSYSIKNKKRGSMEIIITPLDSTYTNNFIHLEIFDGVIRVFPNNSDVTECIIQKCSIIP